jgi:hypothetical protein
LISAGLRLPAWEAGLTAIARHDEHGSATPAASWETWEPAELREPEIRSSVAGRLETSLRVAYAYHDIGGYRLSMRSYEGAMPAPPCVCGQGTR